MYRQPHPRKRQFADPRKRHFDEPHHSLPSTYQYRLNFYTTPPTAELTLDQFEQWAIDRLRVLSEIESCLFRNKSPQELKTTLTDLTKKYLRLEANSTRSPELAEQRRKDHYAHFILRLAFARSEELRKRFARVETILFKHRFETDDAGERDEFVASLGLDWEPVDAEERRELEAQLTAAAGGAKKVDASYFKVDWERVGDLVDQRKVFLRHGKAYVPASLQVSLVVAEFTARLEKQLEVTTPPLPHPPIPTLRTANPASSRPALSPASTKTTASSRS